MLAACAGTRAEPAIVGPQPASKEKECIETITRPAASLSDAYYRLGKTIVLGTDPSAERREKAADQFRLIISDYGWFAPAYRALGIVEGTRGRWVEAYVAYKHYLQLPMYAAERETVRAEVLALEKEHSALGSYARGEQSAADGDWARTIDLMTQVIAQKPSFSLAYRLLAIAYAARDLAGRSIDAYKTYLEIDKLAPDRQEVEAIINETRYVLDKQSKEGGRQ